MENARAYALALSPPCIRAYFIPIRVKRVAGTDGTHTTVYPQLREINLGPISGRPRRCRGTNDFPQRRTRSNETVPLVPQILLYIFEHGITLRIHAAFFCVTTAFLPARRGTRASGVLMEILNRASGVVKLRYIHRDTNVTATYATRRRDHEYCGACNYFSLRDHKL